MAATAQHMSIAAASMMLPTAQVNNHGDECGRDVSEEVGCSTGGSFNTALPPVRNEGRASTGTAYLNCSSLRALIAAGLQAELTQFVIMQQSQ